MSLDTRIAEAVRCLEVDYRRSLDATLLEAVEIELRKAARAERRARVEASLQHFAASLRGLVAPGPRSQRGHKAASVWPA